MSLFVTFKVIKNDLHKMCSCMQNWMETEWKSDLETHILDYFKFLKAGLLQLYSKSVTEFGIACYHSIFSISAKCKEIVRVVWQYTFQNSTSTFCPHRMWKWGVAQCQSQMPIKTPLSVCLLSQKLWNAYFDLIFILWTLRDLSYNIL